MGLMVSLFLSLLMLAVWFLLLFVVVRAAVISAMRAEGAKLNQTNQLLGQQSELTARLAKHLIAQSDLMLAQARHQGMTDEELSPVTKQLEERKADPVPEGFSMPFK